MCTIDSAILLLRINSLALPFQLINYFLKLQHFFVLSFFAFKIHIRFIIAEKAPVIVVHTPYIQYSPIYEISLHMQKFIIFLIHISSIINHICKEIIVQEVLVTWLVSISRGYHINFHASLDSFNESLLKCINWCVIWL